jgi:formylglycine-generating enzyme required for sulfatase activity
MGSADSDAQAQADEKPQHRVRITGPFYLGATEVTQGQYRAVIGQSPSAFNGSDDLPVEQVSWIDAVAFCDKLSEREKGALGGARYRLPTEAEWEYACRAGSTSRYGFGDDATNAGQFAWYYGNSGQKTQLVGQKWPNAWRLHDMHGNVAEWCGDPYGFKFYGQSPSADPLGPWQVQDHGQHVLRGGSWNGQPSSCRSAYRNGYAASTRFAFVGIRVARLWAPR